MSCDDERDRGREADADPTLPLPAPSAMRPPSTLVIALALSAHAVAGCSDDSTPSHGAGTTSTTTGAGGGGGASAGCPAAGATECVGAELRTCVDEGGALAWGAAEACPGEQHCHEGACVDPTASQLSQVATLETFVDQVADIFIRGLLAR